MSDESMRFELGRVIASRELEARAPDGVEYPLRVLIGEPVRDPREGGDWICPARIEGIGDDRVAVASGVDSLQALLLCVQMLHAKLQSLARTHGCTITWLGREDLGFEAGQDPQDTNAR